MDQKKFRVLALLLLTLILSLVATAQDAKRKKACNGCPTEKEVEKILRERYEAQFTEGWMKDKENALRIEISPITVYPAIQRKMHSGPLAVPVAVHPVETTVKVFVNRGSRGEKMEYMVGAESKEKLVQMFYFRKDGTGKAWTFNTGSK